MHPLITYKNEHFVKVKSTGDGFENELMVSFREDCPDTMHLKMCHSPVISLTPEAMEALSLIFTCKRQTGSFEALQDTSAVPFTGKQMRRAPRGYAKLDIYPCVIGPRMWKDEVELMPNDSGCIYCSEKRADLLPLIDPPKPVPPPVLTLEQELIAAAKEVLQCYENQNSGTVITRLSKSVKAMEKHEGRARGH